VEKASSVSARNVQKPVVGQGGDAARQDMIYGRDARKTGLWTVGINHELCAKGRQIRLNRSQIEAFGEKGSIHSVVL
jgi:hypothetical protein